MGDPDLPAITAGPAGARDLAVGGGDDRAPRVAPKSIPWCIRAKRRIGWTRMPKPERDPRRDRPGHARPTPGLPDVRGIDPLRPAVRRPFDELQVALGRSVDAGVEQRPGLALAGCRAAAGDDQVEAVVHADVASNVDFRRQRLEIFGRRLRRHAGRAERPVEAVADAAADAQRRRVDRHRLLDELQAAARRARAEASVRARRAMRYVSIGLVRPCLGPSVTETLGSRRDSAAQQRRSSRRPARHPHRMRLREPAGRAASRRGPRVIASCTCGRSGAKSIGSTASVAVRRKPVSPPAEIGAIARAVHWCCCACPEVAVHAGALPPRRRCTAAISAPACQPRASAGPCRHARRAGYRRPDRMNLAQIAPPEGPTMQNRG